MRKDTPMKTLILSANTGGGHNSCSNAIKTYYEKKGYVCDIVDGLSFISSYASKMISSGDINLARYVPVLFRKGYEFTEKHSFVFSRRSIAYKALVLGTKKLYHYINENGYDNVISTHAFTSLCLTGVVLKYSPDIKTAFVATDYSSYPTMKSSCLDRYFIANKKLAPLFIESGVPAEKIVASGIPVREQIMTFTEKCSAKRSLDIPEDKKHIIIMGGSCGCGNMQKMASLFEDDKDNDCIVSVVCGTNEKLKVQLEEKFKDPKIRVFGFVDNISLLMDSADLLITKPGGICVTEAAQKRLPMVFIDSVCGCEPYNMEFFTENNMALSGKDETEIYTICKNLLQDEMMIEKMIFSFELLMNDNAAEIIFNSMIGLNGGKTENE